MFYTFPAREKYQKRVQGEGSFDSPFPLRIPFPNDQRGVIPLFGCTPWRTYCGGAYRSSSMRDALRWKPLR